MKVYSLKIAKSTQFLLDDYYQFAAKLITSKPLSPSLLKEKRKLRSALPYPFYLIGILKIKT